MAKQDIVIESLSVKYRPKNLKDLVGQSHIVSQITGMLKANRFPSTILVSGPSGTGKTTLARLISSYVNCKSPLEDYSPCGECMSCKYGISSPDIHEINMADNRGIDDVRSMIQMSKSMPSLGSRRIFIIDECHAATPQAFQAQLKILEDSPKKTMWLLCTTNPEKLPDTIKGRAHKLSTKPIEREDLIKRLVRIAKNEGYVLKERPEAKEVLNTIVDIANGRMRDSIQMLESYLFTIKSNQKVQSKDIITAILQTSEAELEEQAADLLIAVLTNDYKLLIKTIRSCPQIRGLISKTRWLIQYFIDNSVSIAKFVPYSAKKFNQKNKGIKVKLLYILDLQNCILEIETKLNSISVDEQVVMLSMLSAFMIERA